MNTYAFINIFGLAITIVMIILYFLHFKRKIKSKTMAIIWKVFSIVMIGFGVYVLSVREILRQNYPAKHYTIGAVIVISLGIIILIRLLLQKKPD